jgi:hypothetical protein
MAILPSRASRLGTDNMITTGDIAIYSEGIPDTSKDYVTIPTLANPISGSVTLTTYDTVNRQVSGTFNFIARKAHNLSDTVSVTGGSFYQVEWGD